MRWPRRIRNPWYLIPPVILVVLLTCQTIQSLRYQDDSNSELKRLFNTYEAKITPGSVITNLYDKKGENVCTPQNLCVRALAPNIAIDFVPIHVGTYNNRIIDIFVSNIENRICQLCSGDWECGAGTCQDLFEPNRFVADEGGNGDPTQFRYFSGICNADPCSLIYREDFSGINSVLFEVEQVDLLSLRFTAAIFNEQKTLYRIQRFNTNTLSFAVISDTHGNAPILEKAVSQMNQLNLDFCINLGGIANKVSELNLFSEMGIQVPVYSTIGNEVDFADAFRQVYGEATFSFDYLNTYFLLIDSADKTVAGDIYDWLQNDFQQDLESPSFLKSNYVHEYDIGLINTDSDLRLIFMHVPPFDFMPFGENAFLSQAESVGMLSILAQYKANTIFAGNYHGFQSYTQGNIQTYITGGGGGTLETADDYYHFLYVQKDGPGIDVQIIRIE